MTACLTSCEDSKEPVYHAPTSMTVNTPGLKDQLLVPTGNMEDKSTFLLTTSQPDYGYSAIAVYGAQMSLSPNFKDATDNEPASYVTLENQNPSSAVMSLRLYDLAVGMCQLLGIESEDDWADYKGAAEIPVYFRATCELAGVAGSFIASSNSVSYNKVRVVYAVPTAGFIYITGKIENADGVANGFKEPSEASKEFYDENDFKLYEPVIGSKVYANSFVIPKVDDYDAALADPDLTIQWRFFSELVGWDVKVKDGKPVQFGSNEANFYVQSITTDFVDGLYTGPAVTGQGNWGVVFPQKEWLTMVVDLQDVNNAKVYYKEGRFDVDLELNSGGLWQPVWNAPAE